MAMNSIQLFEIPCTRQAIMKIRNDVFFFVGLNAMSVGYPYIQLTVYIIESNGHTIIMIDYRLQEIIVIKQR